MALDHIKQYITIPIWFSVQDSVAVDVREFLKVLYDYTKCMEDGLPSGDALPELIIQGFDEEQIWQELELQNEGQSEGLLSNVATLVAHKDLLNFPVRLKSEESVADGGELQTDDGLASASDSETDMSAIMEPAIRKSKGQQKDHGLASASDSETDISAVMEPALKKSKGQQKDDGLVSASDSETDMSAIIEPAIKKSKGQFAFVFFSLCQLIN
jgi:U3 small nucleolar RNA-associated protein MPP10